MSDLATSPILFLFLYALFSLLLIKKRHTIITFLKKENSTSLKILLLLVFFVFIIKMSLLFGSDLFFFLRDTDFSKVYIANQLNDINYRLPIKHPNFFYTLKFLNTFTAVKLSTVQVFNSLMAVLYVVSFYFLAKRFMSARGAFWASLMMMLWPVNLFLSLDTDAATLTLFWTIFTLLTLLIAVEKKDNYLFLISLISLFFAITTRANNVIFLSVYILLLIFNIRFLKNKTRILLLALFTGLGSVYTCFRGWCFLRKADTPGYHQLNYLRDGMEFAQNFATNLAEFITSFPGIAVLLILPLLFSHKNINKNKIIFIYLYLAVMVIFYCAIHYEGIISPRYLINITIPLFIIIGLALETILKTNSKALTVSGIIIILLLGWDLYWIKELRSYPNNSIISQEYQALNTYKSRIKEPALLLTNNKEGFLLKTHKLADCLFYGDLKNSYPFELHLKKLNDQEKTFYIHHTAVTNTLYTPSKKRQTNIEQILRQLDKNTRAKKIFQIEEKGRYSFLYKITPEEEK